MSKGKRRAVESLCASACCRSIRRSRIDRALSPLPSRMRSARFHHQRASSEYRGQPASSALHSAMASS
eukprot:3139701-Pleurochrysis_carterae.AAC.1